MSISSNNKQKIVPGVFELVVENSKEEVDLLLNKIETLTRPFSMNILKMYKGKKLPQYFLN